MTVVDGTLQFTVDGNASLTGCSVFPVTLARTDENTLDGTIGKNGHRALHMVRK